jgi:prepilin-type N-terminal cleavage/methylation domain-containing protein/prepilin-type processing-associated H-X9-DG protein
MRPAEFQPRRHAFTLVEVLIVLGIIAVLAGLLLTVRSRASNQAAQVMCMSNLRQLGLAMTMYAQENSQTFPFSSPADPSVQPDRKEDWIHYNATTDDLPKKINGSSIAPYVKARGQAYMTLMQCPSDEADNHYVDARRGFRYPYSYTMNYLMTPDRGKLTPTSPTPRVTAMPRPSQKILLAEENERTINDGLWAPGGGTAEAWNIGPDFLSIRHDSKKGEFESPTAGPMDRRGNVVFVDGHAEYVSRKFAHDAKNLIPNLQ